MSLYLTKKNKTWKVIPIQLAGEGGEAAKKNSLEDSGYNNCLKFSWFPQKVT